MESGLKQRIIGAVVLVVAAVIFLPMLLSGQDETERVEVDVPETPVMDDRDIAVAPPPTLPEPTPVPEIPVPAETPATEPEPVQELAVIEPPPAQSATEPAAEPVAPGGEAAAQTAAPTQPAPTAEGGWVVQQASFSSQTNADNFRQTLAGQGYNAYVRSAEVDGKTIVRVYVGPLTSREAATRVRDELERRHQSKGMVVAYDDATRAP